MLPSFQVFKINKQRGWNKNRGCLKILQKLISGGGGGHYSILERTAIAFDVFDHLLCFFRTSLLSQLCCILQCMSHIYPVVKMFGESAR